MSTNLEIIADALRALNVINEIQTPSAEQGAKCLRKLNQLLAKWAVDGTVLGYFAQSDTSATCPIPDWAECGVANHLALYIAADFGAEPSIVVIAAADSGFQTILRTVMNLKLEGVDMSHLPVGSGHYGAGFDITTGTIN
jgi:hypothetical protein